MCPESEGLRMVTVVTDLPWQDDPQPPAKEARVESEPAAMSQPPQQPAAVEAASPVKRKAEVRRLRVRVRTW